MPRAHDPNTRASGAPLTADPCDEIHRRLAALRDRMAERSYQALLVYGNNKLFGSLRYLSGYFTDRAGWISLAPDQVYLFEGAILVVPVSDEPVLLVDPGLTLCQVPCVENVSVGSLTSSAEVGLTPRNLADVLAKVASEGTVGIETWERFPAPLYLAIAADLPEITFEQSTLVEEMRLVKSDAELALLRSAAEAGDQGHQAFEEALRSGPARSEIELIRIAEYAMRSANPIYEDGCSNSPSMISSGTRIAGERLHAPTDKQIEPGDIVHWDICSRHLGYSIDTSRTRIVGSATPEQAEAYAASLTIFNAVVDSARPGILASELVNLASDVAQDHGFELWARFLGHGVGIDVHERPDMGVEATPLEQNMTLAIEPRVEIGPYLIGHEDVVLVNADGAEPLNHFPKEPFEL